MSKSIFRKWIVGCFILSISFGLTYLTVQQSYRQNANDPQIQMSEDMANNLQNGAEVNSLVSATKIDISKSLNNFIIIFDDSGKQIYSEAFLDHQVPTPPSGVFAYTRQNKQDRFTWQPKEGVRIAAVMTRFDGGNKGFVLAGRSLKEVEKRKDILFQNVVIAWVISNFGLLAIIWLLPRNKYDR